MLKSKVFLSNSMMCLLWIQKTIIVIISLLFFKFPFVYFLFKLAHNISLSQNLRFYYFEHKYS
jgi:hypothetical protein